jgi:hypothetical protein
MPSRYYFDFYDGPEIIKDDEGTECADLKQARKIAIETLGQIAKDELIETGDRREFTVKIRDEQGREQLVALLHLRVGRST